MSMGPMHGLHIPQKEILEERRDVVLWFCGRSTHRCQCRGRGKGYGRLRRRKESRIGREDGVKLGI